METNVVYALTRESDNDRIDHVVERLHNERNEVTEISWELFTTEYMGFDLPNGDELTRSKWVDFRSTWVSRINERFIELRYPHHLEVVWGVGVELLSDNPAVMKKVVKRVRKQATATANATHECRRLIDSKMFPRMNRLLSFVDDTMRNSMLMVIGHIDSDNRIPKNKKLELKQAIRQGLPPSEPLLLGFDED